MNTEKCKYFVNSYNNIHLLEVSHFFGFNKRIDISGFKYHQPPPLPSNYVCRQKLLDEMATKLCQAQNDPNAYGTSLTVTGAGGFGKRFNP